MFNPRVYENSRPDGIGVLEILGPNIKVALGVPSYVPPLGLGR